MADNGFTRLAVNGTLMRGCRLTPSSRWLPESRCISPIRRARGGAAPTRTPMAFCANIFRKAQTCRAGTQTTPRRSLTPSTPDHARPADGGPLLRRSITTYARYHKLVLRHRL